MDGCTHGHMSLFAILVGKQPYTTAAAVCGLALPVTRQKACCQMWPPGEIDFFPFKQELASFRKKKYTRLGRGESFLDAFT